MPIAYTQPSRLAAVAALFGIAAPAADRARVLELGCAAGGNIIPLAARFPRACFLGIAFSPRQVEEGRRRIVALGLTNIQIRYAELTELSLAGQIFDFVICHGVFSWVPRDAQDAIFRLCGETLAPNGLAIISYNVLPGWHLRSVVRDLCLHHAGQDGTPQRRVARARAALDRVAGAARETDPYGLLLRHEAEQLRQMPASYILGEFLAPHNIPCHFRDSIERAWRHELGYLCEGDLAAAVPQILNPATRGSLSAMAGSHPIAVEQQIDFLTGRPARRSVLIRGRETRPWRIPRPDQLRRLHFAGPLRLDTSVQDTARATVFRDDRARAITTNDSLVREALLRLARLYPASATLDELIAQPRHGARLDHDPRDRIEAEARISEALLALVQTGQANVSTIKLHVGQADAERPRIWRLARLEAVMGQPWLTSLRHVGVPLTPVVKALLVHLDGENDHAALRMRLADALRQGAVQVPELQTGTPTAERIEIAAAHHVDRTLRYLARHALLEPGEQ
jgi:SAM-dependent methyltransferase/methyltransferase-like protein